MKVVQLKSSSTRIQEHSLVQKLIEHFATQDKPRLRFLKNNPGYQVFGGFVA